MESHAERRTSSDRRSKPGASPLVRILIAALVGAAVGCRQADLTPLSTRTLDVSGPLTRNLTDGCVAAPHRDLDYFPERLTVRHADQFSVAYHRTYKVLDFRPTARNGEAIRYLLVQCGLPVPGDYRGAVIVPVPAFRIILDDPSLGSALVRLNALDHLGGVNSVLDYSTSALVARIQDGSLVNTGSQGHSTLENSLAADPDLIFPFYSAYPQHNLHPRLREMGVPAVPIAAHFESTPLGRAEWLKFVALFLNRERDAERLFTEIERDYTTMARLTADVERRPEVMWGATSETEGWAVHGGRNFLAQYIVDAGGRYFWQDDDARSLVTHNFERVFDRAEQATIWLGYPAMGPTRTALLDADPRIQFFNPYRTGRVYVPRKRGGPLSRTLYRDQSLDHPAEVLADLIAILHPDRLPGHEPFFYERLE